MNQITAISAAARFKIQICENQYNQSNQFNQWSIGVKSYKI
jgi:hypothetical protein